MFEGYNFQATWPAFSAVALFIILGALLVIFALVYSSRRKSEALRKKKIVLMQCFQPLSRGLSLQNSRLIYAFLSRYSPEQQKIIAKSPHKYYQDLEKFLLVRTNLRDAIKILAIVSGPRQATHVETLANVMRGELGSLELAGHAFACALETKSQTDLKLNIFSTEKPPPGQGQIYIYRKHGGGFLLPGNLSIGDAARGEYLFHLSEPPRPAGDRSVMVELSKRVRLEPFELPHEGQEQAKDYYVFSPIIELLSARAAQLADNLPPEVLRRKIAFWKLSMDGTSFKGKLLSSRKSGRLIFRFESFDAEQQHLIQSYFKVQEGTSENIN